jgi:hypothetical protein
MVANKTARESPLLNTHAIPVPYPLNTGCVHIGRVSHDASRPDMADRLAGREAMRWW